MHMLQNAELKYRQDQSVSRTGTSLGKRMLFPEYVFTNRQSGCPDEEISFINIKKVTSEIET
jgi:hypothetical protein